MSYLAQYRLTQNGEFLGLIRQALLTNSWLVINEPVDTPNHEVRKRMADLIFQGSPQMDAIIFPMFLRFISANEAIANDAVQDGMVVVGNVDDAAVDQVIRDIWDGVAALVQ